RRQRDAATDAAARLARRRDPLRRGRLNYDCAVATTAKRTEIDPLDFIAIDSLLSDEERAIRDTVRRFVSEKVKPYVGEWFERGEVPRELIPELAQLGLFGMHHEGYGLPEASSVMYGLVCQELE